MIAARVKPPEFFLANDMRFWAAGLIALAAIITALTVVSAYRDYRATRSHPDVSVRLVGKMVLRQEILMLVGLVLLLVAAVARVIQAAPEPGLSVLQSAAFCLLAVCLAAMSLLVNIYRAKILAVTEWKGEERRRE